MENIVIIDCGSQFNQLIARRVRELKTHGVVLDVTSKPPATIEWGKNA